MEPLTVDAGASPIRPAPDPLSIGLSMVNWLFLMLLMSGFLLATTTSERSAPAATSSGIGSATAR